MMHGCSLVPTLVMEVKICGGYTMFDLRKQIDVLNSPLYKKLHNIPEYIYFTMHANQFMMNSALYVVFVYLHIENNNFSYKRTLYPNTGIYVDIMDIPFFKFKENFT